VGSIADSFSPRAVVRKFLDHCHETLKPLNDWMQANPNKGGRSLKNDYKRFPGKQDHATVVVYRLVELERWAILPAIFRDFSRFLAG
jgi:hypothetical protein